MFIAIALWPTFKLEIIQLAKNNICRHIIVLLNYVKINKEQDFYMKSTKKNLVSISISAAEY